MNLISDTLHYRPDGTVSSVTRVVRETYRKPSGAEASEEISSTVGLDAIGAVLGPAYAGHEAHNQALEAQLAREREEAAADKAKAIEELTRSAREAIEAGELMIAQLTAEREEARAIARDLASRLQVVTQAEAEWTARVSPILATSP